MINWFIVGTVWITAVIGCIAMKKIQPEVFWPYLIYVLVAIITLVSAVTSALVSGLVQIITKWIESHYSKKQAEITSEHEAFMMKEKNLQEIRMKRLDKYYDERKDLFQQFVRNATLFLNDP